MKEGQRCPMPRFAPHRSQLVSPKTKKRWTVADAQAVVTRMAASGLSVREVAEAEGLEAQRIYRSACREIRRPVFSSTQGVGGSGSGVFAGPCGASTLSPILPGCPPLILPLPPGLRSPSPGPASQDLRPRQRAVRTRPSLRLNEQPVG